MWMSRGRNRPPRLEPRVDVPQPSPPPTIEALIERSKIVGASASGPGPTELRRRVERMSTGDRRAFGELEPIGGLAPADVWLAVTDAFGATDVVASIDATRTVAATRAAVERVRTVAASGARIAIATASPASLLMLHLAFARLVCGHGGELIDLADVGPIRSDGRTGRRLRWVGGVAVVTDGRAICASLDGEAAREWIFAVPRPALVVADGAFAEIAWDAGIEVVAMAGLDRPALAVAAARHGRGLVVPMHTDRPAQAYRPLEALVAGTGARSAGPGGADPRPDCGSGSDLDVAGEVPAPDPEL
jgi:Phosphatase